MRHHGRGTPGYSEEAPPRALVSLDAAGIGHAGEVAFYQLVERAEFKFSPAFWPLVPPPHARRAEVGFERFKSLPRSVWKRDADYSMYRKAMMAAYHQLCRDGSLRLCRAWLARTLIDFGEAEAIYYMRDAVQEAVSQPTALQSVEESAGDDRPLMIRKGLRAIPEMAQLISALREKGFDVWALSSANQWAAETFAKECGIHPSRVVGIRPRIYNGKIIPELVDPVPEGIGEAEAVTVFLGSAPPLMIGGPQDLDLLGYGSGGLRLVLGPENEALRELAARKGWRLQPAFEEAP